MINIRNYKTVFERRKALEKELKISLSHIGRYSLDEKRAGSRNCENMIGITQIPLGIAGPIRIQNSPARQSLVQANAGGKFRIQNYFIPLATTEGALVASVNRGCKAITEAGGAIVEIETVGATRGPVFRVENIYEGQKLTRFLTNHFSRIKKAAENTSSHLTLKNYDIRGVGKYRYVRFYFDTQDAMGLNMITIATDAIVKQIEKTLQIKCIDLSGNFCVDKKPAWQNFVNRRGTAVRAEIVLPQAVLTDILKTTASKIYESWLVKCMLGSAMSGAMGFNAQYANIIAAIFIATGQDPAHVVEGSLGITTTEIISHQQSAVSYQMQKEDLYISVYLPDLMVGTVGGGTGLDTQKEALNMMGISGGNNGQNSQKLAQIIGTAVLAGEISLLASLSEGSLAKAHLRFARGKR